MTKEVLIDAAELHVEVAGEGLPLVFVHGLGLQAALWNRLCDALGTGYQLVRVSLRGSPRSRELEQRELSLERWASDLGAVVDALELDRPVLVGHSLGGAVVLRHALDRPFAARALVLMCTEADLSNLAPRMLASAERIEREGLEPWLAGAWVGNPPFSAASLERDPTMLDEYRDLLRENDPADYVRQCRAIASAESLSPRIDEVVPPTLVLVGSQDDRTLPEHGRALAAGLLRLAAGRARRRAYPAHGGPGGGCSGHGVVPRGGRGRLERRRAGAPRRRHPAWNAARGPSATSTPAGWSAPTRAPR